MLKGVADALLFINNIYGIMIAAVLMFAFFSRQAMLRVIAIWVTAVVGALALKSIWQIPLDYHLHLDGWAFPSGHTMVGIAFWGGLALETRKWWAYIAALLFLWACTWAMVWRGYHHWADIGAAALITIPVVVFYEEVLVRRIIGLARTKLLLCLAIIWNIPVLAYFLSIRLFKIWPWMAEGLLVGLLLGTVLEEKEAMFAKFAGWQRFLGGLCTFALLYAANVLYPSPSLVVTALRGFLCGFVLSYGGWKLVAWRTETRVLS